MNINKQNAGAFFFAGVIPWLILIVFWMIVVMAFSPNFSGPGWDREIFRYGGMLLRQGKMIYIDLFDHKPPFIYILAALSNDFGPWGLWAVDSLFLLAAAICMWRYARREQWLFPLLYPLLLIFLLRSNLKESYGITRTFSSSMIAMALPLIFSHQKSAPLLLGLLTGSIFMTQQNEVLPLIPLLIYGYGASPSGERKNYLKQLMVGLLIVFIPIGLWVYFKDAWNLFFQQAFSYNFQTYIPRRFQFGLTLLPFLHSARLVYVLCFVFVLITPLYFLKFERRGRMVAIGLAIFFSLCAISISGRKINHYFLGLFPILIFAFGSVLKNWIKIMGVGRFYKWIPWGMAVCFLILLGPPVKPSLTRYHYFFTHWGQLSDPKYHQTCEAEVYRLLENVRGQEGQFYAFPSSPLTSLNTDFNITAPTPYVYAYMWEHKNWDLNGEKFNSILDQLDQFSTTYVAFNRRRSNHMPPSIWKKWVAYLEKNYDDLRPLPYQGRLLVRKSKNPGANNDINVIRMEK